MSNTFITPEQFVKDIRELSLKEAKREIPDATPREQKEFANKLASLVCVSI